MKIIFNQLILSVLFGLFLFSCQNSTNNKKVEAVSAEQLSAEISKKLPEQPIEKEHPGKSVYKKNCLTCHQSDGSGVPNMHPPLGPGSWIEKDPEELTAIMMKGLSGQIEVNGQIYKNHMPSQAKLTDEELADVLTYVRSSFRNNLGPVTADLVKKVRSGR
jgi:mono/diheme cytochrome c family protein